MSGVEAAGPALNRRALILPVVGCLTLLSVVMAWAYQSLGPWLHERYTAPDSFYGHGPLVPLVSLFLLWRDRRNVKASCGPGSWWGLVLVIPALALNLVSSFARVHFGVGLSLLLLLPGMVLLLGGRKLLRQVAFPLGFLVFALPVPLYMVAHIVLLLKGLVITASVGALNLFGADIGVEGSFLLLPDGGRLLVDEECCGLRSLIALIGLGILMAGTARDLSRRARVFLLLISAPLALFANVVRVMILSVVGLVGGADSAASFHDLSTYAVYVVAILVYVGLEHFWPKIERKSVPHLASVGRKMPWPRIWTVAVLTGATAVLADRMDRPDPATSGQPIASISSALADYRGSDQSLTDRQYGLLETRKVLMRDYRRLASKEEVLACVVVAEGNRKSAHPPEICYRGQGWTILSTEVVERDLDRRRPVICLRVRWRDGDEQLVYAWYRVGEQETVSVLEQQWMRLVGAFKHEPVNAALLRFSTPVVGGDLSAAHRTLARFLKHFLPELEEVL